LLANENLDDVLTWQEKRQVSASLTVNYQRRLFLLKETDQARALAGRSITVIEFKDGSLQLRFDSRSFPFTELNKDDARVTQGAIVSNKLLAGALQPIKEQQAVRDADKLRRLRTHRKRQLQLKRTAG
jgi:hypothetical protein